MPQQNTLSSSIRARALAGLLILGLGGRIATALIAVWSDSLANISIRGFLQVMIVGAIVGAVGGWLLHALRNTLQRRTIAGGIFMGLVLFLATTLLALLSGRLMVSASFIAVLTLFFAAGVFIIYGAATAVLLSKMNR
ncbi:MAG: hypothetical protein GF313_08800 [Caldithrix sp.]|nr:hypothetical protein [Caldithrix sp.]